MSDGHLNLMASHHHHAGLTILEQDGAAAAALSSSTTSHKIVIHQNGSKPTTKRSHRFRRRSRVPPPRASESYRYNYQQQQGDDDDDGDECDSDDDCYQDEGDYVERRHYHQQHLREHKTLDVLVAKKKKAKIITKPRAKPITFSNPLESHRLLTSSSTAAATIAAVAARRHWETSHATRQDRNNDSFQTLATVSTTASASTAAMYDDGSSIASSQERVSPQRIPQYSKTVIPNPLYPPPPPPPCLSAAPSATASNKIIPSLRSRRPRTLTLTATPPKQALFHTNAVTTHRTANQLDVDDEDDSESFLPSMPLASSNTTTATAFADVATDQQADTAAVAAGNGIRPSLDAGMAAVRRWIQSKTVPSATLKTLHHTATATRPVMIGKAVANVGDNNSSIAGGEDDEEDWLSCVEHQEEEGCDDEDDDDDNDGLRNRLLRDLQDQASSLASDSNIMFYNNHADRNATRMRNTDSSEEGDERNLNPSRRRLNDLDDAVVGSSSTAADNRHRQRALSEPNGLLLRDDIFQRALQGGFRRRSQRSKNTIMDHSDHNVPSRSHTAATAAAASERSRQFWNDNLHVVPLPAAIMRTSNHTSMASSSHDPSTFMFHKNTATIAALSQRSTFFSDSEDDFGANVTVASSSRTFEMTPIVSNNNSSSSSTNHSSSVSGLVEPAGTNQVSYLGREDATAPTLATTTPLPSSTQPLPSSTGGSGAEGTSDQEAPPPEAAANAEDPDPNRASRLRWIRINRRFQLIITVVALIFSLLLFGILVCWVVLTSAYVVSIDKICDVPLKPYFWLVTLQLILDVFRSDIMRLVCRWDANSRERIPCRVISYNILYLTYALLVLRLGIRSVYIRHGGMCRHTAPELYQSSAAFVTLSIAAWSTIILGYLVPFCFVATLLTWNGYTPASDADRQARMGGGFGGVFPSTSGAPPGCIDQMRVVLLEEFPHDFPRECCICIGDFASGDEIVATTCNHVFHKQCCREWLRQARTCPVCRADIPTSLSVAPEQDEDPNNIANGSTNVNSSAATTLVSSSLPSNPGANRLGRPFARDGLQHEVVSLLRFLRQHEDRILTQQQRQQNRSSPNSLPHLSSSSIISPAGTGDDVGGRTIRLELPPAPSSAPMSTSRHGSLVPSSQSDGDLASMEEGLSTSSNHHQHSM